jgi:hypothetical protein
VRKTAIDALVDSFHYCLHLVVFPAGGSLNPELGQQRHEEHLVVAAPAQSTLIDILIVRLDVSTDIPMLPEMSHDGSLLLMVLMLLKLLVLLRML